MTSPVDPEPMSRTSAILYAIGLPLALLALVFLPAGRIDWSAGWIFIAVLVGAFGLSALVLARVNPVIVGDEDSRHRLGFRSLRKTASIAARSRQEIPQRR